MANPAICNDFGGNAWDACMQTECCDHSTGGASTTLLGQQQSPCRRWKLPRRPGQRPCQHGVLPRLCRALRLHAQPTQCAVPLSTSVAVMACQRCTALHMRIVGCTTATTRHAIPAIAVHVRPLHLPGPSSKLRRAAVAATEAAAPLVATSAAGGDPHADHQPAVRIT